MSAPYEVDTYGQFKNLEFTKINPMTSEPEPSVEGFLLPLCAMTNNRVDDVYGELCGYTSGLIINIPEGYYGVVTGTSALTHAGYQLPHPVIVTIEDNNREFGVELYKLHDKVDLALPLLCLRMTLHRTLKMMMKMTTAIPSGAPNGGGSSNGGMLNGQRNAPPSSGGHSSTESWFSNASSASSSGRSGGGGFY